MKQESGQVVYLWQHRFRKEALKQDRGVLDEHRISRMEIRLLSETVLFSSQGTPERSERGYLRRMRSLTKNSSIHLFFLLIVILLAMRGTQVFAANAEGTEAKIQAVGDDFEALMLQRLFGQMRAANQLVNSGDNNPFAPSHAEMIFRGMQEQAMMKQLAARRPLGIGNMVVRQLKGLSGIAPRPLLKSKSESQGRDN